MSIAAAPVRPLSVAAWHELCSEHEGRCELVRGRAIMTPTEAFRNIDAVQTLVQRLNTVLGDAWKCRPNASILLQADPEATVRVPDLAVMGAWGDPGRWRADASEVALVVEVVSPSSVETDWVTKREEYAAAGIPNYLIVDVRFNDGPRLWLFDEIVPVERDSGGEPTTYPRYADPTGDGTSVTLRIPGTDPITITATDLV